MGYVSHEISPDPFETLELGEVVENHQAAGQFSITATKRGGMSLENLLLVIFQYLQLLDPFDSISQGLAQQLTHLLDLDHIVDIPPLRIID